MMAIYSAAMTSPVDDPIQNWEDECTLQFGVEDDDIQQGQRGSGINAGGVIFREYGGEDFSKYLDDDDEVQAFPLAVTTGSGRVLEEQNKPRYQKRQSRKRPDEGSTIGAFDQVESPADPGSGPGPRKSLDGLRDRIAQFLPGTSKTRHRSKSRETNKIQNYSFTDLRIGSSLLTEQQRLSAGSSTAGSSAANATTSVQHESDSGSEIRSSISLETRSDLGFRQQGSSWWNLDTLSDRQGTSVIESNGHQRTRNQRTNKLQRRAESVPDLLDSREAEEGPDGLRSPDSGSSGGATVLQRRHLGSVSGGLVNCWDEDVRRQAEQSTTPKTAPGRSIWKRLTHTINKRTRRSKGLDGGKQQQRPPVNDFRPTQSQQLPPANDMRPMHIHQQRPPANDVRPSQIPQQRPPANANRPPPTPPPNSPTAGIYDEIRL